MFFSDDDRARIIRIERMVRIILRMEDFMAGSLDRLRAAVAAETTVSAAAMVLLNDISAKLKEALASGDQAALDQLAADLEQSRTQLAAAIEANTPAAGGQPAPVPPPDAPGSNTADPIV